MVNVKDAPRTSTTIMIRSDSNNRITHTRDPFFAIMRRLFQKNETAQVAKNFLCLIDDRQTSGDLLKTDEWVKTCEILGIKGSSFYSMRNKLLGAGLISVKSKEYRLSNQFTLDLIDMADWWQKTMYRDRHDK